MAAVDVTAFDQSTDPAINLPHIDFTRCELRDARQRVGLHWVNGRQSHQQDGIFQTRSLLHGQSLGKSLEGLR